MFVVPHNEALRAADGIHLQPGEQVDKPRHLQKMFNQTHGGNVTTLTKPISRETSKSIGSRNVIVTLAPAGSQSEALIGLRLKGKRTQYVCALSDIYRMAALWHGQKEAKARKEAKRNGISWKTAKKQFAKENSIVA